MKNPRQVIKTLLISEKSLAVRDLYNTYAFEVDSSANKIDIKHAVETLFKVKVEKVTTINNTGKERRLGRYRPGRTPNWKKAMVKLAKDNSISELESL